MQQPLQITFRDMEADRAIETTLRRKAAWLERYFPQVVGCRVVVEAPHRRRRRGRLYHVRVDVTLPGGGVVARRAPAAREAHREVRVAIRDAFDATRRMLMDEARRRRGQIKEHRGTAYAVVSLIHPDGYGFIETDDGRQLYFHASSVLDGFERLAVGKRVRYAEERGEKGPQASTVAVAGKRTHGPSGARP